MASANEQSLAESLSLAILTEPQRRLEMGLAGKKLVEKYFDPTINGKKLEEIYQS